MADDMNFKAEVSVEVNSGKAVGEINSIVAELKKLNETTKKVVEELVSLNEKGLKRTATVAKETAAAIKQTTTETEKLTKASKDAEGASRGWNTSMQNHYKTLFQVGEVEQNSSRAYRNISTSMDGMISSREQVGKDFSRQLQAQMQDEQKFGQVAQTSGRNYLNASTMIDGAIKQREDSSKQFAKSLKEQMQLEQQQINSLPRLRYALYDVANASAATAAIFAATGFAILKTTADFETAFTAVERTTLASEGSLDILKNQLISLSREIPLAFTELSKIASLGAQLGVATSDLSGFTKTVSMFAATTNVSIDEAAKSFGSLGELLNVPASQYNNLGSAIAFVGVESVATESEILSVANAIGGIANSAELSAQYTIGLSGALASLRVPAEQSRGALTRTFQEINRAASDNGPVLQNFANIMGLTQQQAKVLAETDLQGFFQQFLQGLSGLDSKGLTSALDSVNLADIRVTNTLTRLSQNLNVVNTSIGNSEKAFESGSFLALAYGYRVEDLASKFQIFQNAVLEIGDALGSAISPTVGVILDSITDSLQVLASGLRTDAGKAIAGVTVGIIAFVAALSTVVSIASTVGASIAALKTVIATLGVTSAASAVGSGALGAGLTGVGAGATGAAAGLGIFKVALISTGIGAAVVALGALAVAFASTGASASEAFNTYVTDTSGLADAVNADVASYQAARTAGDAEAMNSFVAVGAATENATTEQINYQNTLRDTATVLGQELPAGLGVTTDLLEDNTRYIGENTRAWLANSLLASEGFQELVSTVINGSKEVNGRQFLTGESLSVSDALSRTAFDFNQFTDIVAGQGSDAGAAYVRQLLASIGYSGPEVEAVISQLVGSVSGFTNTIALLDTGTAGATTTTDGLTESLLDLTTGAEEAAAPVRTLVDYANDLASTFSRAFDIRWKATLAADEIADSWETLGKRIDDAKAKVDNLSNTKARLEYFLSIAVAAGDDLRANELRNELAKTSEDLASATDDASTELKGNSAAARNNRKDLTGLLQSNADYISSLAEQGASQATLRAETKRLRQDFIDQATAMGFTEDQVLEYAKSFKDMNTIINKTPRNVTVTANTNPALQALAEFDAKMKEQSGKTYSGGTIEPPDVGNGASIAEADAKIRYYSALLAELSTRKPLPMSAIDGAATNIDAWQIRLKKLKNMWVGGYTGAGGKYEPAGIVHKGEYVVPKHQVNQSTGLPYADALGRAMPASAPAASSYANGGFVTGGMMVSLSPDDRALLRGVGASGDIVVAVDSREIARANARGARLVTAEGGYLV